MVNITHFAVILLVLGVSNTEQLKAYKIAELAFKMGRPTYAVKLKKQINKNSLGNIGSINFDIDSPVTNQLHTPQRS